MFYFSLIFFNISPLPRQVKFNNSNYYKQLAISIIDLDPSQTTHLQAKYASHQHKKWTLQRPSIDWSNLTPWHLEAQVGEMDLPSQTLQLSGDIHATQWIPPCNRKFITESLTINLTKHQAQTDGPIHISRPGESIDAIGASINLKDGLISFDQILNSLIDTHSSC